MGSLLFLSKIGFCSLPGISVLYTMGVLYAAFKPETIGIVRTYPHIHMCTQQKHTYTCKDQSHTDKRVSTSQTVGVCELQLASPHTGSQGHHFQYFYSSSIWRLFFFFLKRHQDSRSTASFEKPQTLSAFSLLSSCSSFRRPVVNSSQHKCQLELA